MTDRTDTDTLPPAVVLVALHRPDGYEDVHPALLIEDARIDPAFRPEDATDTVRRLLDEQSERIARLEEALRRLVESGDVRDAADAGALKQARAAIAKAVGSAA